MEHFTRFRRGGWCRAAGLCLLAGLAGCTLTSQGREAKHMKKGTEYLEKKDYKKAAVEFKVASQNAEKDPEPHFQLGLVYVGARNFPAAASEFEKALHLKPRHSLAEYRLSLILVNSRETREIERGAQYLGAFVTANPENAEALAALAVAETRLGRTAEATGHLEAALARNPGDRDPLVAILMIELGRGDLAHAKETAGRAAKLLPHSPQVALLRARVMVIAGDRAEAEAEITRALSIQPKFLPGLQLRLSLLSADGKTDAAETVARELSSGPEKGALAAYPTLLLREGKVDQALIEFRELVKRHPGDNALLDQFAGVLANLKRNPEAGAIAEQALHNNGADPDALLVQATLKIDSGDTGAAERVLNRVLSLSPNSGAAYYQLSRVYAVKGETRKQGDLLVEALRRNQRLLQARLELARILMDAGNWKGALELLNAASQSERATPMYLFYRAGVMIAAENWAEARKQVDLGFAAGGRTPAFLNLDARIRMRERDFAGASRDLMDAINADPSDAVSLGLLAEVYRQTKRIPEFLLLIRERAAKNPNAAGLQLFLGKLLATEGDLAGARKAFETAKTAGIDPSTVDVALSTLDVREGHPDRAAEQLRTSIAEKDSALARVRLGEIEERSGAWDRAAQEYRRALDMAPADREALNNLASVLSEHLGKPDEGLIYAEKAKALTPGDPFIEDTIGCIYLRKGNAANALTYLQASAKIFDRAAVRYHLARAYLIAGDRGKAESEYRKAVAMDPKSAERNELSSRF